jgi:methionyl-tRNA formyltransferase
LVGRLLDALEHDPTSLPRIEQDLASRSYFDASIPRDGIVDWHMPAAALVDFVRACDYFPLPSPWGSPIASVGGRDIGLEKVSRTHVVSDEPVGSIRIDHGSAVWVACADEWVSLVQVRFDGRSRPPLAALELAALSDVSSQ